MDGDGWQVCAGGVAIWASPPSSRERFLLAISSEVPISVTRRSSTGTHSSAHSANMHGARCFLPFLVGRVFFLGLPRAGRRPFPRVFPFVAGPGAFFPTSPSITLQNRVLPLVLGRGEALGLQKVTPSVLVSIADARVSARSFSSFSCKE